MPDSAYSSSDDRARFAEAIRSRRSIDLFEPDPPGTERLLEAIDLARWAPNHRLTEPWRFIVLSGDARNGLGEAMGAAAAAKAADPEAGERARAKAVGKPLRAPYVIAVYADPNPAELEIEAAPFPAG